MTLNLIAGTPATTDLAGARVFTHKVDATEVADFLNGRLGTEVFVEVITHYLPSGRRCWVLRQLGGARTVTKYVAEVTVVDVRTTCDTCGVVLATSVEQDNEACNACVGAEKAARA